MNELAGMSIDESLDPQAGGVILDLNDVRQRHGVIFFGDELEGGGPLIELATQRALGLCDGVFEGERWSRRRHRSYIGEETMRGYSNQIGTNIDVLGFTNDEPNDTTLPAWLNATLATALATGTPF